MNNRVLLGVKGDRACFTTPSVSKQNRHSYSVLTPSAARGVVASVFLKPEFDWVVTRIAVRKMGYSDTVTVNEVRHPEIKSCRDVKSVSAIENRIQVTMRILRDVEYVIEAEPYVLNLGTKEAPNTPMKYVSQFERRMDGKKPFYRTPCLGLREFVATVYPVKEFPESGIDLPDIELNGMLVGLSHGDQRGDNGETFPCFKNVTMVRGIIEVPHFCGATFKPGE